MLLYWNRMVFFNVYFFLIHQFFFCSNFNKQIFYINCGNCPKITVYLSAKRISKQQEKMYKLFKQAFSEKKKEVVNVQICYPQWPTVRCHPYYSMTNPNHPHKGTPIHHLGTCCRFNPWGPSPVPSNKLDYHLIKWLL